MDDHVQVLAGKVAKWLCRHGVFYWELANLDKQDQLPEDILEHMPDCTECKVEVMELMTSSMSCFRGIPELLSLKLMDTLHRLKSNHLTQKRGDPNEEHRAAHPLSVGDESLGERLEKTLERVMTNDSGSRRD